MSTAYDGPVIDPHHHLWDLSMSRHPWLAKNDVASEDMVFGNIAPIQRDYGVAEYLADASGQNIVATVHVEAGWSGGRLPEESRWLDTLDKADGIAHRYVARVPLDHPDAGRLIEVEAANSRVVGIRDIVSWHPESAKSFARSADLMSDARWRHGLAAVMAHDLVFDLMLYPWQMNDAVRLAADFPETLFVLNHCGSPADRSADGMALWRRGLMALGKADNVRIKISDLVAYDNDWTFESLGEVIEHCLSCFGTGRAMFASDFPVAGLHASFDEVYASFRAIATRLTIEEQRDLFFTTANQTYRMGLSPEGSIEE